MSTVEVLGVVAVVLMLGGLVGAVFCLAMMMRGSK